MHKSSDALPANFGKPWTAGEDAEITMAYRGGVPIKEIAKNHSRTRSSVRLRLEKLGLIEVDHG